MLVALIPIPMPALTPAVSSLWSDGVAGGPVREAEL